MAAIDEAAGGPVKGDHLSALSWVHDELRRSLELANKALRRYLKEQDQQGELDTVDPSVLRQARSQLHQSVGVLELVGLGRAAEVLRAAEAALTRLSSRPRLITAEAVDVIEHGSFALLDFIDRRLAGKPVSTLALFPQYRALQTLAGAVRVHPADLWTLDWSWREVPLEPGVVQRAPDENTIVRIEADLLALMRGAPPSVAGRMSEVFAGLAAHAQARAGGIGDRAPQGRLATLWQLASAFFEAQTEGLLQLDAYSKRIGSRLLAQLRAGPGAEPSERLAQDLLFFCSQARTREGASSPRLAAVRRSYRLGAEPPLDYEQARLGRFDPAWVAQARKRVAAAKEVWSAAAGGDLERLPGLPEQFSLVGDSLARLYPDGAVLGRAMQVTAAQTAAAGAEPPAELAMEVATALLYLEASIDDGDFDHPEGAQRIHRLAQRIDQVRQAKDPGTLELWMEELYRRVSDRQTMGSVVQELRASLSEIEKNIDQYFRNPAQREVLVPVPAQLQAMRGVLSVLGLDQASQAVVRMRDDIDVLAGTEVDPEHAIASGTFDRLADNLGALSFLIDMVSVQPQMAKSLFRFDPETGNLSAVMARQDRPSNFGDFDTQAGESRQAQPDTDAVAVTLEFDRIVKQARVAQRAAHPGQPPGFADTPPSLGHHGLPMLHLDGAAQVEPTLLLGDTVFGMPAVPPLAGGSSAPATEQATLSLDGLPPSAPAAATDGVGSGLEDDPEMRQIFLDEAGDVLQGAREALAELQARHDDPAAMTTVRRAFHTLKGSARMVGLADFGQAAWACEQLYNARLAEPGGADHDLREFSAEACAEFQRWVDALAAGDAAGFSPDGLVHAADTLRIQHRRVSLVPAVSVEPAPAMRTTEAVEPAEVLPDALPLLDLAPERPAALRDRVPDLPLAADLDLTAELPAPAAALASLTLDLSALDAEDEAPAAPVPMVTPTETPTETPQIDVAEATELDLSFDLADFETAAAAAPQAVAPSDATALELPVAAPPPQAPPAIELDLSLDLLTPVPPAEPPALPERTAVFDHRVAQAPVEAGVDLPLELAPADAVAVPEVASGPAVAVVEPAQAPADEAAVAEPAAVVEPDLAARDAEEYRQIGPLRVSIPLLNIYLNEADELSRRLGVELAEWALEQHRPVGEAAVSLAHSLAGSSGTVGFADLSQLARALEHALGRSQARGHGLGDEAWLFNQASDEIRRLLHLFAAGFLNVPDADLLRRLHEAGHAAPAPETAVAEPPGPSLGRTTLMPFTALPDAPAPLLRAAAPGRAGAFDEDIDAVDAIDAELLPFFVEEAQELLPQLQARLRDWSTQPTDAAPASACMRCLHTLKGSARLAGAMRLGEMAHRLETVVQQLAAVPAATQADVERLIGFADVLDAAFEQLRSPAAEAAEAGVLPGVAPAPAAVAVTPALAIDWQRFRATAVPPAAGAEAASAAPVVATPAVALSGSVRVQAPLLDRLVNQAGEVSIARSRIATDVGQFKGALVDLGENLERLRAQLRDIELQAETQIGSRMEAARHAAQQFDPLEMDRFTRFQELTRMIAESVADVATVQRGLQRTLQSTEDALAHQARMTRDMQDDLLRTRMVEFEGLSERLYRVVRQAAKETGKPVRLDIVGGGIEIDRGVLERMTPAFEHLLRNSVVHGIEPAAQRAAAGKDATGTITLAATQVGNEVAVEVRDDGAGLDLSRIRERARAMGLIAAEAEPDEAALADLVFQPGVTTATEVTGLAGRGVGMDVVRTEVNAIGGRIETASAPGQGASFKLVLPLTTAVTQVVRLRCGELSVAVPSTLVETVRRVPLDELAHCYETGQFGDAAQAMPFFWMAGLLQGTARGTATGRTVPVVVIRSAAQRVALHVDEVMGNQEVVVKNLGPQLSRVPGLVGMTLLPSGVPALIYNPVALATLYGDAARAATRAALAQAAAAGRGGLAGVQAEMRPLAPLVLVVDDSLTVRRITQRLLEREGYRVAVAKDGLDGMEQMALERPALLLTDIEMPRMDGFDLVRNLRADPLLAGLPVIMITSRIAQKHRDYAAELGVDHYLGKPYAEDELLGLVARHARAAVSALAA